MLGQQTDLFLQLAIHRLLRSLVGLNPALRELPGILPHTTTPEKAVFVIAENDPHIWPETVGVYHNWNRFKFLQ